MFWIGTVVFIAVIVLLGIAIFRRDGGPASRWSTPFIVVAGLIVPALILTGLLIHSLRVTRVLAGPEEALSIEVVGHQWWWEVSYPADEVITANEIRVPVGVPVRLEMTSVDVIHSLWVPALNGKMDLIPGQRTSFWFQADEPGIYRGHCAEYCGTQHARMNFLVVAEPADAYRSWLSSQRRPAPEPDTDIEAEGREVFLSSACVYCHTVRGTNATGKTAPDLTHIAGRLTLGAGTVANNTGNLAGWIVNSQAIKPGNRMPPMYLESEDLQALLAYLKGLE